MDMKSISQKLQDDIRAIMEAGLHPNQQKIDVHEPEKDKITAHDFKKLRAMKKDSNGKITKEDTVQEEEKKKVVSPFDYKNYKSQIPKKPGELTGHDSKKTSTGTVYTKRPVKENTDIGEARLPRALHKMSADELNQAHKDNEAEIEAIHKNDPSKRITMNHPLISKRRSINLHKVIRSKQSNPNYNPPKAHGYSEEVEIGEARKLEGTYSHTNGNQSKVYKLSGEHHEGDPYHVKLFKGGKHYEPADYFTNDKEDAHGTAKHMVKEESHQSKTTMKHIPNASPALKKAAKDIKPGIAGYRDRIAMLKAGGVKEEVEELDELSVSTLSSYGKKASRSIDRKLDQAADHSEKATNLYDKGTASAVDKASDHEDKVHNLHKQVNKRNASMDQAAGKLKNYMSKGVAEGSFSGNDKMAKAAHDSGDSKAIVRMRDAKGTYTATMVRKQGEKDHKEISRVYDKKEVEQMDELSMQTMKSAKEKLKNQAYDAHMDDNKYAARNLAGRALAVGAGMNRRARQVAKEEVESEYTFADYLEAARAQYVDEDAVLVANEAFKNQDITLFIDQSQSSEA